MKDIHKLLIIIIIFSIGFSACKKEEKKTIKIGLISGFAGFNDKNFNQAALEGFNQANLDYTFISECKESHSMSEISENLQYFGDHDFNLVITMSYSFADAVKAAAATYPGTDFLIVDYQDDNIPKNILCATYAIDQVSFPAGVLAAYWAWLKDPLNPVAGFVAGPDTIIMNQFAYPYIHGIQYFNTIYNQYVNYAGWYASSYADTIQGAALADNLINTKGVDIIYAFAGLSGNGALSKAKEKNIWGIGVDVDQYYSLPAVKDILLTSCMKRIDNTVYDVVGQYMQGDFAGGTALNNTLNNDGVSLAPYHDLNQEIPDSIKTLITKVLTDIKNGTLSTGWKK